MTFRSNRRITPTDLADLFRELGMLLRVGVGAADALDIIRSGVEKPKFRLLLNSLHDELQSGTSLSKSLAGHPEHFYPFLPDLIEQAEKKGELVPLLGELADYLISIEPSEDDRSWRWALAYPVSVILIAGMLVSLLMIFVVPQFSALFAAFGADLPGLTVMLITFSDRFVEYWWLILAVIVLGIFASTRGGQRYLRIQKVTAWVKWRIPVVGSALRAVEVIRFLRTVAFVKSKSAQLSSAVRAAADVAIEPAFAASVREVAEDLEDGKALDEALRQQPLIPAKVVTSAEIGLRAKALEEIFGHVADAYSRRVKDILRRSEKLLEPWLTVILGVMIGIVVVAMYLPIFKMGQVV